jgi:hypothetical protein
MGANIKHNHPVFHAEPTESGKLWSIWCPFCKRQHFHKPKRGLRQAPCPPAIADAHWPNGYYVSLSPRHRPVTCNECGGKGTHTGECVFYGQR